MEFSLRLTPVATDRGNQLLGILVDGTGMDLGQPCNFTGGPLLADELVDDLAPGGVAAIASFDSGLSVR